MNNSSENFDIDFFETLQTLWDGKWWISFFVVLSSLFAGTLIFTGDKQYQSNISLTIDAIPSYTSKQEVFLDFKKMFLSKDIFDSWKKDNLSVKINFNDISSTQVKDGFLFKKNPNAKLAIITSNKKNISILIKTNQLYLLNDFYNFCEYINSLLLNKYVLKASNHIKFANELFEDHLKIYLKYNMPTSPAPLNFPIQDFVLSKIFIDDSKLNQIKPLLVQRPSLPVRTNIKSQIILVIGVILGGVIGVFFVVVKNFVLTNYKENLSRKS